MDEPYRGNLRALLEAGQITYVPDGTVLWQRGSIIDHAVYVVFGAVEHVLGDAERPDFLLSAAASGQLLGVDQVLTGLACPSELRALGPASIVRIQKQALIAAHLRDPEVARNAALASHAHWHQVDIAFRATLGTADEQLERVLQSYARACGREEEAGTRLLIKRTQAELAEASGLTLRHTNRLLMRWTESGRIERREGALVLRRNVARASSAVACELG